MLYLIFTNDLIESTTKEKTFLYADDTALKETGEKTEEVLRKLRKTIEIAETWYSNNGLQISEEKSELIIIKSERSTEKELNSNVSVKIKK